MKQDEAFAKIVIKKASGPLMQIKNKIANKHFRGLPDAAKALLKTSRATLQEYINVANKAHIGEADFHFTKEELERKIKECEGTLHVTDALMSERAPKKTKL